MTRGHLETDPDAISPRPPTRPISSARIRRRPAPATSTCPTRSASASTPTSRCRDTLKRAIPGLLRFLDSTPPMTTSNTAAHHRPRRLRPHPPHRPRRRSRRRRAEAGHPRSTSRRKGHVVTDFGAYSHESVDYPDFAETVCRDVLAERGRLRHPRLQERHRHEHRRQSLPAHPRRAGRQSPTTPRSPASTTTPTSSASPPITSTPAQVAEDRRDLPQHRLRGRPPRAARGKARAARHLATPSHPSLAEADPGDLPRDRSGESSGSSKTSNSSPAKTSPAAP